jgi:hypothetical protein
MLKIEVLTRLAIENQYINIAFLGFKTFCRGVFTRILLNFFEATVELNQVLLSSNAKSGGLAL